MIQQGAIFLDQMVINLELPAPDTEVVPGVYWGTIDSFPSPAYWAYQVYARRIRGEQVNYKIGETLKEEVSACLLGGHGIPASVGLSAFNHLRAKGVFSGEALEETTILEWLREPLDVNGRMVRYRFAKQKSRYLAAALEQLNNETPPLESGKSLRDWLIKIPGIGHKTASWIARNWLDADDVAILDIHILRAGKLGKFFQDGLTVEKNYLELEKQFIEFSHGLGVRPSELDALIWFEMMSSSSTVHGMLEKKNSGLAGNGRARSNKNHANANQLSLLG